LISERGSANCMSPAFMYILVVHVRQNKMKRAIFGFQNGLASFPHSYRIARQEAGILARIQ